MRYDWLQPDADLTDVVRGIWILELGADEADGPPERVVPDGCTEIVVHYGARMRRIDGDGVSHLQPRVVAAGQLSTALLLRPTGAAGMIGLRLQPWAAGVVFRTSAGELTDRTDALVDVWGSEATSLHDCVASAPSDAARAAVLQSLVRDRLVSPDPLAAAAARLIERTDGGLAIGTVARRLHTGRRTLERTFAREVGVSPKAFSRVMRLQAVLSCLEADRRADWASLAAGCGYSDQAHLTREFRVLAGITPARFAAEQHAMSDALLSSV